MFVKTGGFKAMKPKTLTNDEFEIKKKKRERKRFSISREDLAEYVEDYLASGGKITVVEPDFELAHQSNFKGEEDFFVNEKQCGTGRLIGRDYPEANLDGYFG